ncbi:MAG: hypothetical protein ACI4RQ_03450 [Methanobrevibacter wolinii]
MDNIQKITGINLITGVICGILSAMFSYGTLGFKNEVLASILGIIVAYFIGKWCMNKFQDDIESSRDYFGKGIFPFAVGWFMLWVLCLSYAKFLPFM